MQKHSPFIVRAAQVVVALLLSSCGAPVAITPGTPPSPTPLVLLTVVPTASSVASPVASTRASAPATVVVKEYDLGSATIEQARVDGDRRNLPYHIQGIIAVPASSGPHPLVVITHGSHPGCPNNPAAIDLEIDTWPCPADKEQRNDLGWRYLIEALAKQGYVAVSFNMNAVNTAAWGGSGSTYERYASIVDAQLAKLVVADQGTERGFGVELTGRIDFKRTALVGHSQGGGFAMIYANKRRDPVYANIGGPLAALLLVAPATQLAQPEEAVSSQPTPADIPTGIVMGLCDGDVSDLQGFTYYEQARSEPQRLKAVQVVLPYGANHNFFNTVLGPDGLNTEGNPGCDRPAGRLSPAQQQAFLGAYAHDFFATVFDNVAPPAAWQANTTSQQQLYSIPALTALLVPSAQRQPLVYISGNALPTDASGVAVSTSAPLQVTVCSAQNEHCNPATYGIPAVQNLSQPVLSLNWKQRGGALNLTVPANLHNLTAFTSIGMRVALDGFTQANTNGQAFTLRLRDMHGKEESVVVPAETYALQPPTTVVRDADKPQPYLQGVAPLAAIRIPLARFNDIDVTQLESIALVFDQTDQGALFVTDLEVLH